MSLWNKIFGKPKDPSREAMGYINQIPQMAREQYEPFIKTGQEGVSSLQSGYGSMATDPAQYINALMQAYQPSKAYQFQRDEGLRAAGNTAAAGGYRGTEEDILNSQRLTSALLGQDMQNWLGNVLGAQGAGLSGLHNLYNTGFNAAQGLSGDVANAYGTQGSLAFQGAREHNQRQQDRLAALGQIAGNALPMLGSFL